MGRSPLGHAALIEQWSSLWNRLLLSSFQGCRHPIWPGTGAARPIGQQTHLSLSHAFLPSFIFTLIPPTSKCLAGIGNEMPRDSPFKVPVGTDTGFWDHRPWGVLAQGTLSSWLAFLEYFPFSHDARLPLRKEVHSERGRKTQRWWNKPALASSFSFRHSM